jgi:hypothetical protein
MKKVILVLPLILIINKAVAGQVVFSKDENYLEVIIPASILIIWWLSKIIRKNYLQYKSQLADKVREQEGKSTVGNELINTDTDIPEFFREKDVFGLDKPSIKIDPDTALHQ